MQQTNNCHKLNGFKLWLAFVLGLAAMVIAAVFFQYLTNKGQGPFPDPDPATTQAEIGNSGGTDLASLISAQDEERPWLGVEVQTISQTTAQQLGLETGGLIVNNVMTGSPAEEAGIKRGDVIVMFDRRKVEDIGQLQELMNQATPGSRVKTMVMSIEGRRSLYVKLGTTTSGSPYQAVADLPDGKAGETTDENKHYWGVTVSPWKPILGNRFGISDPEKKGVMVTEVASGSSAEQAGLRPGDLIKGINRQPTPDMNSFFTALKEASDRTMLDVSRQGQGLYIFMEPINTSQTTGGIPTQYQFIGGDKIGQNDNDNDEEDGGYKGKPPVIPPKGKSVEDLEETNGVIVSITDLDNYSEEHLDKPLCKRLQEEGK